MMTIPSIANSRLMDRAEGAPSAIVIMKVPSSKSSFLMRRKTATYEAKDSQVILAQVGTLLKVIVRLLRGPTLRIGEAVEGVDG